MKEKILCVDLKPSPRVKVRVINEHIDDDLTIKSKKKYPFQLLNDTTVFIVTSERTLQVEIPKLYVWNGADIPKTLFWVGQSKDNNYLIASMVHDYLLQFKEVIFKGKGMTVSECRRLTSLVFREILKNQKTNVIKANIMAWAVDVFQATLNRKQWECLK